MASVTSSIDILYRLQGWFEIRDDNDSLTLNHARRMLSWIESLPREWIGPPLAYLSGRLEAAVAMELPPEALPAFFGSLSEYLDTVFEHYVNPAYPGDAALLQPAPLAAAQIHLRPVSQKLTPHAFCYRTQGYLELSGTDSLSPAQAQRILAWLERLSTRQSCLWELRDILTDTYDGHTLCGLVSAHMRDYFIRYIDPGYPGGPDAYHPIHRGETNPLIPAPIPENHMQ